MQSFEQFFAHSVEQHTQTAQKFFGTLVARQTAGSRTMVIVNIFKHKRHALVFKRHTADICWSL